MKNVLFLFLLAGSMIACNSNSANEGPSEEQQAETAAYQEVMDMHDAIMAEMGNLRGISQKLEGAKTTASEEQMASIDETIAILNQAQESMMTWMQGLGAADPAQLQESKSHEEIMEMINEQKSNAEAMRQIFDQATSKGESVIMMIGETAAQ